MRRHRIDVDDNVSMWAQTVDRVEPRPALEGRVNADVVIVGAGFTGMSTAYEMSGRFPQLGIVVLEARTVGNGASGRNGGMMLNWVNGIDTKDEAITKRIWETTQQGMDWIAEEPVPMTPTRSPVKSTWTSAGSGAPRSSARRERRSGPCPGPRVWTTSASSATRCAVWLWRTPTKCHRAPSKSACALFAASSFT